MWSESVLRACYCMKARRPLKATGTGLTACSLSGGTRISVARLRGAEKIQRIPESLRVHDDLQHDIAIPMIAAAQQPMTNDRHHPPEHTSPLPSLLRSPQSRSSMPFSNSSTAPPPHDPRHLLPPFSPALRTREHLNILPSREILPLTTGLRNHELCEEAASEASTLVAADVRGG